MAAPLHDPESQRRKRELRARIARQRRRIDRSYHALVQEADKLRSWRTYVRHFPVAGLAVGFGLGLSLSAGLSGGGWSRWVGRRLVRRGMFLFSQRFFSEVSGFWTATRPDGPTEAGLSPQDHNPSEQEDS